MLPVEVNETPLSGEPARRMVRRLAEEKARLAAQSIRAVKAGNTILILAADTTVVLDGEILGKPADDADARRMLRRLSGRTHEVITGVALLGLPEGTLRLADETTLVTFAQLSDAEIETYVATGETMDKAGAYAIQGGAARFVTRVEGSYSNVVGLPVELVKEMLRHIGGSVAGVRW